MENPSLQKIFMISEDLVNPHKIYETPSWSMWLELSNRKDTRLELKEVNSEPLWNEMFNLRSEVEKEFGDFSSEDIKKMISAIKHQVENNHGKWFLAYLNEECVGEIGIIPISYNGKVIYRLQDVDVVSSFRGQGLGNNLLNAISNLALDEKVFSLCLRADANDWKKDWYLRYGFQKVGEVGS
ncbi:MAG: hypothetical protein CME64_08825 [Halobacteriovoraceae bacterium]|nr:hypothetical protein [Halobacteriovoraceae bacterium]|tara:strand:+ start:160 stop:708 length:549 start_codon:yes stop_codon:yes gene_type:complete